MIMSCVLAVVFAGGSIWSSKHVLLTADCTSEITLTPYLHPCMRTPMPGLVQTRFHESPSVQRGGLFIPQDACNLCTDCPRTPWGPSEKVSSVRGSL